MATYQRFEDLPVWQAAAELFERCDEFLAHGCQRLRPSFRDQLERAALSVSKNIAEGFERGTTAELLHFLYIARGSAGEVRSMLLLLLRRPSTAAFNRDIEELSQIVESCSRQLRAWADALQNSEIAGQRHLNEQTRATWRKRTARQAGTQKLHEMQRVQVTGLPREHPLRRQWEQMHGPLE